MLEVQFKRQRRDEVALPSVKLLIYVVGFIVIGGSALRTAIRGDFGDFERLGNYLLGLLCLMVGVGMVVAYALYLRWRHTHPVLLVFDENGFGGPRLPKIPKGQRIPWKQVASAKLVESKLVDSRGVFAGKQAVTDNETAEAEIEVTLVAGDIFKIDVHHLDHTPFVIFSEFKAFIDGRGHRLTGEVAAPLGPKGTRRFRVTTRRGGQQEVHEVESNTPEEATAFAVLGGLTVVSVEELPVLNLNG